MSTRSMIIVDDGVNYLELYKHHDGYCSHTLDILKKRISEVTDSYYASVPVSEWDKPAEYTAPIIADALIGGQDGIKWEENGRCLFDITNFNNSDLEYVYYVDVRSRNIRVYNMKIEVGAKFEKIDPISDALTVIKEFRKMMKYSIISSIAGLIAMDWTVNEKDFIGDL